ncbi:MAG: HIT domain-containing protein [Burkholderiales bacterium]|nr:HIT domain-containing protein [Burkholderiales bacterium]MCJ7839091.1 HIT domain-containing protein [Burkholderiales bacterium]
MTDCVFCGIVAGRIPSTKVHEDELTLAFMDIGEVNPGHVLVTVKPHAENIYALDGRLAAAAFQTAARVARAINKAYAPEGLTLYQANGVAAGQTVYHFHLHLVPRYDKDGMRLTWPAKNPPRDQLEANAARLRAALE